MRPLGELGAIGALTATLACGGKVVFVDGGEDGGGGGHATPPPSVPGCTSQEDCAPAVCILATGECREPCMAGLCDPCKAGEICDGCATPHGTGGGDCVSACMPATAGLCDENDPCPGSSVCRYPEGVCLPSCSATDPCDGATTCQECATGSCCGCKDCVAGCVSF